MNLVLSLVLATIAADPADLTPVKHLAKPNHQPIVLAENGKPVASIAVMGSPSSAVNQVVDQLQQMLEVATGAKLPIVRGKATKPAIVIMTND